MREERGAKATGLTPEGTWSGRIELSAHKGGVLGWAVRVEVPQWKEYPNALVEVSLELVECSEKQEVLESLLFSRTVRSTSLKAALEGLGEVEGWEEPIEVRKWLQGRLQVPDAAPPVRKRDKIRAATSRLRHHGTIRKPSVREWTLLEEFLECCLLQDSLLNNEDFRSVLRLDEVAARWARCAPAAVLSPSHQAPPARTTRSTRDAALPASEGSGGFFFVTVAMLAFLVAILAALFS